MKVFRKIRASILKQNNKMSKYALYAMGEIVLVVLGILIALQVNQWNLDRINRQLEKAILTRVVQDLKSDIDRLQIPVYSNEMRMVRGVWIMEKLGKNLDEIKSWNSYRSAQENFPVLDSILELSFGRNLAALRYYSTFEETRTTIQEILSTGKLDIIRNEDIKNAIQSHYAQIDRQKELQRLVVKSRDELMTTLTECDISMFNNDDLDMVLSKIEGNGKIVTQIENFLYITGIILNDLIYGETSIEKLTNLLILKIESHISRM